MLMGYEVVLLDLNGFEACENNDVRAHSIYHE